HAVRCAPNTLGGQRERERVGGILSRCVGFTANPSRTHRTHSRKLRSTRTASRATSSVRTAGVCTLCQRASLTAALVLLLGRMQVPWFPALLASPRSTTTPPCA